MRLSALLLLPLLASAASCGGGGSGDAPSAPTPDVQADAVGAAAPMSDQAVIARLYDPNYRVPDGFFVDERSSTAQSYTVHHVVDESASYELCTDDFATAEAWELADNDSRSVRGYYVGAYENQRYFEFIRELSYNDDVGNVDDLTSPGFARVFKCSNTTRDGVDRSALSGYAGRLNRHPVDSQSVRDFAEYLWQFTFFPQRHKKVLASLTSDGADGPARTLLLGFASTRGGGQCDLVEVVEWRFVADPPSGNVTSDFRVTRRFEAELVNGSPQLCGG